MTSGTSAMNKMSILVIDDEDAVREAVGDVLATLGLRVLEAANGQTGITLYREHQRDIELVLLDLSMQGLDGAQTLAELRKINPGVRVVVSTGYSEQEILNRLSNVHVAGFLRKPYDVDTLIDMIQLLALS